MFKIFNRPLSPHLSIYTGQITSIFSILHRFSALIMIGNLVIFLVLLKCWTYNFSDLNINYMNNLYLQNWIFLNLSLTGLYHFLNGFRHIIWDFGWGLKLLTIKQTALINSIIILSYIVFLVFNMSN